MQSNDSSIQLLSPDPDRDALFALSWFQRPEGHATLLSMGNANSEIEPSTLEGEMAIMREFISLEQEGSHDYYRSKDDRSCLD